jgi:hypothetical protein
MGRGAPLEYRANIRYRYEVASEQYEGDVIAFGQSPFPSRSRAEERTAVYPPGAVATVHYDPRHPATATLETGMADGRRLYWQGVWTIMIAFLVSAAILLV